MQGNVFGITHLNFKGNDINKKKISSYSMAFLLYI